MLVVAPLSPTVLVWNPAVGGGFGAGWDKDLLLGPSNWESVTALPPPAAHRVPGPGDDLVFDGLFGTVRAPGGANVASITVGGPWLGLPLGYTPNPCASGTIEAGETILIQGALTVAGGNADIQSAQDTATTVPTVLAMNGVTVGNLPNLATTLDVGTNPAPAGARFTEVKSATAPIVVGEAANTFAELYVGENADINFRTTFIGLTPEAGVGVRLTHFLQQEFWRPPPASSDAHEVVLTTVC